MLNDIQAYSHDEWVMNALVEKNLSTFRLFSPAISNFLKHPQHL
jgi:hypothetical protein